MRLRNDRGVQRLLLALVGIALCAGTLLAAQKGASGFPTSSYTAPSALPAAGLPPTMLWAWERPEILSSIDPARVGVAFLAEARISLRCQRGREMGVSRRQVNP
ncbi:MAG: hypothetical protein ACRD50_07625 [Candidatus Acidiferrales bacterium]